MRWEGQTIGVVMVMVLMVITVIIKRMYCII